MKFFTTAVTFCSVLLVGLSAAPGNRPPNVVVILADDLGYGDLGCYGGTAIPTPNIDRLAQQGRRFTQAYAPASTCTPSRYGLLTGEYAWRQVDRKTTILAGDAPLCIAPGQLTLPSLLQRAGYATGLVGKWHLGVGDGLTPIDFNGKVSPGPREVGFDFAFYVPSTMDRVPTVFIENHRVVGGDPGDPIAVSYVGPFDGEAPHAAGSEPLKMRADRQHSGTVVNGISRIGWMKGGRAARWADESASATLVARTASFIDASRHGPFFLFYAAHQPHVPRAPHSRFVGATTLGPRGDAIVELDWVVGEIMGALERAGVADHTLVMLTSDNGPVLFDGYFDDAVERNGAHRAGGELSGGKYSAQEGGTRVPWIVRWPDRVRVGVDERMVCLTDLVATCAALAGQEIPTGLDSVDQSAVLTGAPGLAARTEVVQQGMSNALGFRSGRWKLVTAASSFLPAGRTGPVASPKPDATKRPSRRVPADALYDLEEDPSETTNVIAGHADIAVQMRARLAAMVASPAVPLAR